MTAPADRRHPNVSNLDEAELQASANGRFACREVRLGEATGGRRLGCSYDEVDPGKTAYPFHWHAGDEESAYVLDGEGTLRIGEVREPVRAGDYVTFPCGLAAPHQLLATGDRPLRYLCFSANAEIDICGYPDSNKLAAAAGALGERPYVHRMLRLDGPEPGYYDGEDVGE